MCRALRSVVVETWADCWAAEFMILEPPPMDEAMEYMDIRLLAAMIVAGNWAMLSLRRAIEAGGLVFQGHQTQRLTRSLGLVSSRIVMLPRVFEGPAGVRRAGLRCWRRREGSWRG